MSTKPEGKPDLGAVTPQTLERIDREEKKSAVSTVAIMRAIKTDLPGQLSERIAQRDLLVAQVLQLNLEIAQMQTTLQVGADPKLNGPGGHA